MLISPKACDLGVGGEDAIMVGAVRDGMRDIKVKQAMTILGVKSLARVSLRFHGNIFGAHKHNLRRSWRSFFFFNF